MIFVKPQRVVMKGHPQLTEKWVQSRIAEDPNILGLGDLVLRDRERIQPRAGRLDLLLQNPDTQRRYEVEIQLGTTDEAHIIRAIEYWDIERKRYPQYDHCAVLVAEDVTSRFLNVMSLFNGVAPFIAIQMQALQIGDAVTLVFTKVLDELTRGLVDEDEDAAAAPSDRAYWEARSSAANLRLVDDLLNIVHRFEPGIGLKYNKFYIGLARGGEAFNFVLFRPQKSRVVVAVHLPRMAATDAEIEKAGVAGWDYDDKWGRYRLPLGKGEVASRADFLETLFRAARLERGS